MATRLQDPVALHGRTGDDRWEQRDGHRAEPAVARAAHGRVAKWESAGRRSMAAAARGSAAAAMGIPVREGA